MLALKILEMALCSMEAVQDSTNVVH